MPKQKQTNDKLAINDLVTSICDDIFESTEGLKSDEDFVRNEEKLISGFLILENTTKEFNALSQLKKFKTAKALNEYIESVKSNSLAYTYLKDVAGVKNGKMILTSVISRLEDYSPVDDNLKNASKDVKELEELDSEVVYEEEPEKETKPISKNKQKAQARKKMQKEISKANKKTAKKIIDQVGEIPDSKPSEQNNSVFSGKVKEVTGDGGKIRSISGNLVATTEERKMDVAFREINDSLFQNHTLIGTVFSVERTKNKSKNVYIPCPSVMYKGVKIVFIPRTFGVPSFIKNNFEENSKDYFAVLNAFYTSCIGSEIEFKVTDWLDKDSPIKILLGDRVSVLREQEKANWFELDKDGYYTINPGNKLEARVLSSKENSVTVECRGVESTITRQNATYVREDLRKKFAPGDKIVVKVLGIERDENHKIVEKLVLSAKDDIEPFEKWRLSLKRGSTLLGEVVHIDSSAYHIRVDADPIPFMMRCNLKKGNVERPMIGSMVQVIYTKCDPTVKHIYGTISRIIRQ